MTATLRHVIIGAGTAALAAVEAIRNHIHPGQLIILESTTYPGTTREMVLPVLEAKRYVQDHTMKKFPLGLYRDTFGVEKK